VQNVGGVVFFGASGGSFEPSTAQCTLSSGSCAITFRPSPGSEGPVSVAATYQGDVDHYSSTASPNVISATPRTVKVSLVCAPSSILSTQSTTCTVTVTDSDAGSAIVPGGVVTFSADVYGTFTPLDCTLVSGSCSVVYTPPLVTTPTTVTITAAYGGDFDHYGGSDSTTVNVT
jgi:hypothetical protein